MGPGDVRGGHQLAQCSTRTAVGHGDPLTGIKSIAVRTLTDYSAPHGKDSGFYRVVISASWLLRVRSRPSSGLPYILGHTQVAYLDDGRVI